MCYQCSSVAHVQSNSSIIAPPPCTPSSLPPYPPLFLPLLFPISGLPLPTPTPPPPLPLTLTLPGRRNTCTCCGWTWTVSDRGSSCQQGKTKRERVKGDLTEESPGQMYMHTYVHHSHTDRIEYRDTYIILPGDVQDRVKDESKSHCNQLNEEKCLTTNASSSVTNTEENTS